MKKGNLLVVFLAMAMLFVFSGNVLAADLVTVLHKTFRDFNYPHEEKVVGMEVRTRLEHQEGDRKSVDRINISEWHEFKVSQLKKRAWEENDLKIDDLTAQNMETVIGYRIMVNVYQCGSSVQFPYRHENKGVFLNGAIAKMEECLTYELQLQ